MNSSIKGYLNKIEEKYNELFTRIDNLVKENERLRSEHYKDEELSDLKSELNEVYGNAPIILSKEAKQKATKFIKEHCDNCHDYKEKWELSYVVFSSPCGDMISIRCCCGKEFELMWI